MKIKYLLSLLLIVLSFKGCSNKPLYDEFDKNILTGEILITNTFTEDNSNGICLYDLKTNQKETILPDIYFNWQIFSNDKKKIIAGQIFRETIIYDRESKKYLVLPDDLSRISYARYVPEKNEISYVTYGDRVLYTYNFDEDIETEYLKVSYYHHSWKSDGNSFFYSKYLTTDSKSMIFEHNIITGEDIAYYEGYAPEISPDNRYLAYLNDNGHNSILTIKEISTENEWIYEIYGVFRDYRFAPHGDYIILVESLKHKIATFVTKPASIKVWDFKNNTFCFLSDGYKEFHIDWK